MRPMLRTDSLLLHVAWVFAGALACLVPASFIALPAALLLLLWMPGRLILRLCRPLQSSPGGVWLALTLALVLMPVALTWVWEVSNERHFVLAAVTGINLGLVLAGGRFSGSSLPLPLFTSTRHRRLFTVMMLWIGVCVFGAFWIPSIAAGGTTTPAHDYIKHHAVMLSLERYALPLHNMLYQGEPETPYYYYHYAYLTPAALRILSGGRVSIPFAFGLTAALLAVSSLALVYLLAYGFLHSTRGALLSTACVSIVGGFDIVPILIRAAAGGPMVVTLDAWCPVPWRIHNLATQFDWCPQHVSALLALLLAAHGLRRAPRWPGWIILAPLIGASIFGSSVYLAMTVFSAAAIYALLAIRDSWRADARAGRQMLWAVTAIACLGALLMGVQAYRYHVMSNRYDGGLTLSWARFPYAALGRWLSPGPLANLMDAPWIILVELGLPAVALLLVSRRVWSRLWADAGLRLMILAAGLGALAMFTVRSDVHKIDYGFRVAIMALTPLAAICAGALMDRDTVRPLVRGSIRAILIVGVVLGLPVGLYEVPLAAGRTLLERRAAPADAGALAYLRDRTPIAAVVQGDPKHRLDLAALVNRRVGILDPECAHVAVFRPINPGRMGEAFADVQQAFRASFSADAHATLCRWQIDFVLAGSAERKAFGGLAQFNEPRYFEIAYTDGQATVYRVKAPPDEASAGGTP